MVLINKETCAVKEGERIFQNMARNGKIWALLQKIYDWAIAQVYLMKF